MTSVKAEPMTAASRNSDAGGTDETVQAVLAFQCQSTSIPFRFITGVVLAGLLTVGVELTDGTLQFAEKAIREAGETPPKQIALKLEALRRWQAVGNTAIVLAAMGGIAATVMLFASRNSDRGRRLSLGTVAGRILGCAALASVAGVIGWILFRLRPMGDQDLMVSSLIGALVWGILGFGVALAISDLSSRSLRTLPKTACIVALWGLLAPALLTILIPSTYVGTVIPNQLPSRYVWTAVGGIVLSLAVLRPEIQAFQSVSHCAPGVPPIPNVKD